MSLVRSVMWLIGVAMLFSAVPALAQVSSSVKIGAADEASWRQVQADILERYGIIVANRTAAWSLKELVSVRSGLDAIAAEFSSIVGHDATSALKGLLHGAVLYRDGASDRIAYTVAGAVYVYDLWTTYDQSGRAFYLAHEIGHLLDTRTSPLQLLMGEVSGEFAQRVGAFSDEQGRYQLGRSFPHHGSPGDIRHRSDRASEDWAESFATVVVPAFEASLRDIGDVRESEVHEYLYQWDAIFARTAD